MDLEQLKHKNSTDAQALTQPYQPVVYAIPKPQWEAMLALMKENLPFMDAIHRCFSHRSSPLANFQA